ncbi:hypothetical protein [Rhizobium leguminosarum]|uniref:hypothetical protein n=1 Tax=Rhizobium leguminosarum TaxID=384 RepID=UPI001C91F181|nr:hypothetical protein [Rhizobium leguminosarum]MBY2973557.1 hypothetical protein [Rhizobium leguminosarum]MBY2980957.1 hypothetical protein [Rhizobium leguminosarum]MBY3009507.1 hypothetical protein [Rhizobium leguminosarum]
MPFHLSGNLEMDVPKLAAANWSPGRCLPQAVFFWPQFLHENDMVMQIFAKILPR